MDAILDLPVSIQRPDEDARGASLVSLENFDQGETLFDITDVTPVSTPTYQSVQIGVDQHVLMHGALSFLNHSCAPNVHLDVVAMRCLATRSIQEGDELSFFYPSTEWEMDRAFDCLCGAKTCLGSIQGARYLAEQELSRYSINPHIWTLKRSL